MVVPAMVLNAYTAQNSGFTNIDLSQTTLSGNLNVFDNPSLAILNLPVGHAVANFYGAGNAFTTPIVDALINSFNPAIPGIVIILTGGTSAPRSSASDAVHDAILLNGGSISWNP